MKYQIAVLSLGLIISGCVATKPAPYEVKGSQFYGKNQRGSSYNAGLNSDINEDFVYKGRTGESNNNRAYNDPLPAYPGGSITKKPLDPEIKSSKLAPPTIHDTDDEPKLIEDNIDSYEDSRSRYGSGERYSSNTRVPTFREGPAESDVKARSSDYLDLTNVKKPSAQKPKLAEKKTEVKLTPEKTPEKITEKNSDVGYLDERNSKLQSVAPKQKPEISENTEVAEKEPQHEKNEHEQPELNITAKEKPKILTEKKEPEHEEKIAEKTEKPAKKIEKAEKATPKETKTTAVEDTQDNDTFIEVPASPPTKQPAKPEVKKADTKTEPKLEIASAKPEPEIKKEAEVKKQDIASIPKIEPASTGPAKFIKPVEGKIIQEFGSGSDGITIQAPEGTAVKAAGPGEVVYSGNQLQGYGNMIVIKHSNGYLTAYSHLEDLPLKKGSKVAQGDVIGQVGKSGNVTTPQLHFGVRKGRSAVNPRDYLN